MEGDIKIAKNRQVGDNRVMGVEFSSETALEIQEQAALQPSTQMWSAEGSQDLVKVKRCKVEDNE